MSFTGNDLFTFSLLSAVEPFPSLRSFSSRALINSLTLKSGLRGKGAKFLFLRFAFLFDNPELMVRLTGPLLPQRVTVGKTYGVIVSDTYLSTHILYTYNTVQYYCPSEPGRAGKETLRPLLAQSL